jgi:hypothetical protein
MNILLAKRKMSVKPAQQFRHQKRKTVSTHASAPKQHYIAVAKLQ